MTMTGSLPSFPAAATSVGLTDYNNFRDWVSYAAEYTSLVIRSDSKNPDEIVLVGAELATLEEPVNNDRAICEAIQFPIDITNSGMNGLDTGTVAANTTYYIWMVGHDNDDDKKLEQYGAVFSTSATSPTMPTVDGDLLDFKWLIGCCFTDANGDIIPFIQEDILYTFLEAQLLTTLNTAATHAIDCNSITPAGCHVLWGHLRDRTTSGTTVIKLFPHYGLSTELWYAHGTSSNPTELTFMIPELLEGTDRTFDAELTGTTFEVDILVDSFYWPGGEP